jgi:hypothetical protein
MRRTRLSGGGGSTTVRGVYQQPYQGNLGMESSSPSFVAMLADVPSIKRGDTYALRSTTYTVSAVHKDPLSGLVVAELHT